MPQQEVRVAKPFVSRLNWVLNGPINERVNAVDAGGNPVYANVSNEPGIGVTITPYLKGSPLEPVEYKFPKELAEGQTGPTEADVLGGAQEQISATWAVALDSMANTFDILKDPTAQELTEGIKCYLRLDAWRAEFTPTGENSQVSAIVGIYASDAYETPIGYHQLLFIDPASRQRRAQQLVVLNQNIAQSADMAAGNIPNSENMTAEEIEEHKLQAARQHQMFLDEKTRVEVALVGNLEELLAADGLLTSVGQLIQGVFTALKSSQDSWADANVASLMVAFQASFMSMLSAPALAPESTTEAGTTTPPPAPQPTTQETTTTGTTTAP
jgi:hypothetical protein